MKRQSLTTIMLLVVGANALLVGAPTVFGEDPNQWASQVTIHRDTWGVPHIRGTTDASVAFGSAYSQCEDHFWQLEDSYIQSLGRYAEVVGERGLRNDLETRLFEVPSSAERDFATLPDNIQQICNAFASGYNYYLANHPETKPRLITQMLPHHVLAFERWTILGRLLGAANAPRRGLEKTAMELKASVGSNQWAVGPSKTADGSTMLFINPHQPWYGWGMFTEMHVRSDEGWNFSGAMYPGGPFPTAGFNERLGWAYTVNKADISDVYRVTFDHPTDPLKYRYGDGYRDASQWPVTIGVKSDDGAVEPREFGFRKTHYGPIISQEDEQRFLAVRVPKLYTGSRMVQTLAQAKAKNFEEWYAAVSQLKLQTFNTMYADADGNIFYLYNGTFAERDPSIDWTKPVDGSNPKNEWGPFHPLEELPQVLNPISGFIQNCNSTPFTTTDDGNPSMNDFPPYMVKDKHMDMRRAKMARHLLRKADDITFDQFQSFAFDTTLYWPMTAIPVYERHFRQLQQSNPELVAEAEPYLEHLLDWDFKSSFDSTQTTLAMHWFIELYGRSYPGEELKMEYRSDIPARFDALVRAAKTLESTYGDWKVPFGKVHRIQRHPDDGDVRSFDDTQASLPMDGAPGPLGVALTIYYVPPTGDPTQQLNYAVTGASYMACFKFGPKVEAMSYLHYGQSHNPDSPHYFDQAKLISEHRFKPAWFYWDDVVANTAHAYHPGEE